MAEYMEKDALIQEGWHLERTKSGDGFINIERREIKDIPAADVREVVRGKWIEDDDGDGRHCSVCGNDYCYLISDCEKYKFCPNCGSDMREVTDNAQR